MPDPRRIIPLRETPEPLHGRALADLDFIRSTMEASTAFTAVPGRGMVAIGLLGVGAAAAAARQDTAPAWLMVWLATAALAAGVALASMMHKARAAASELMVGAGRRFALAFLPPVVAAMALTVALARAERFELLPGTWMILYGVGLMAGGTFSVPTVPALGGAFALAGLVALFEPSAWGDVAMALTFGLLHVIGGIVVWRRHGG
jgi:hypothetical protein